MHPLMSVSSFWASGLMLTIDGVTVNVYTVPLVSSLEFSPKSGISYFPLICKARFIRSRKFFA